MVEDLSAAVRDAAAHGSAGRCGVAVAGLFEFRSVSNYAERGKSLQRLGAGAMRDGLAVDKWMLLAVVGLVVVGVTMVLSTSYLYSQERFRRRHVLFSANRCSPWAPDWSR